MIRRLLQSVLCIFLSPLLAAQQVGQTPVNPDPATPSNDPLATPSPVAITIPKDTKIELVSLNNVSSEFAVAGTPVRFAMAKDIVLNGVTVIHAGAPVTGFVTKAKRSVARHQWARLTIRVREMRVDPGVKLRLSSSNPKWGGGPRDFLKNLGLCIAFPPWCVAWAALSRYGCGEDSCDKPKDSDGQQALLPQCVSEEFWVKSKVAVSTATLDEERLAASTYPAIPCSRIIERSQIFGQPGISYVDFQ
jgi:hypothetical protein